VAQGYPPRRSARMPAGGRRGRQDEPGRRGRPDRPRAGSFDDDAFDDSEENVPPWAGLDIHPTGPGGRPIRPPRAPDRRGSDRGDGRAGADAEDPAWEPGDDEDWAAPGPRGPRAGLGRRAATRARKSRNRLITVCGLAAVVLAVLGLWATNTWPFQTSAPPAPANSGLITTYQRGELRTIPNACSAIGASLLSQYLPGKVTKVSQSAATASQSQCTWTLDAKPNFRVLTVSSQAYAPSLLATGNGSATFNAIDAYAAVMQGLQDPPKSSKLPKAQIGAATGLGNAAFTALQVFHLGGAVTDEVTVVARDRNVLIDVSMQGQERGGGFGPVPDATLTAAALAAAHEVLAGIR
jgi:hypothetical protein